MATNAERILALLQEHPGLDDDELSRMAGVTPRQQVNQICRRLEKSGVIRREVGPRGKVVNSLAKFSDSKPKATAQVPLTSVPRKTRSVSPKGKFAINPEVYKKGLEDTLILIPCSGAKTDGGKWSNQSIPPINHLQQNIADRLSNARAKLAKRIHLDNSWLRRAWERYNGSLYRAAYDALARAMQSEIRPNLMIVSGGYGLALANELIGSYDAVFRRKDWPTGLLEEVLLNFVGNQNIRRVRAFASMTTEYGKFLRGVPWTQGGIQDAIMFCPEPTTGAMVLSPRAQGEALAAFLDGRLGENWRSSDGLKLLVFDLAR